MTFYLLKYWKITTLTVIAAIFIIAWQYTVRAAYNRGHAGATAEISAALAKAHSEQSQKVRTQEQKQAAEFATKQAELEKEKQHAENTITNLRRELSRVQQYAQTQSSRRNLPSTHQTTAASDEAFTKGWALFGECTARYAEMAEVADRQRNDLAEWQAYGKAISDN